MDPAVLIPVITGAVVGIGGVIQARRGHQLAMRQETAAQRLEAERLEAERARNQLAERESAVNTYERLIERLNQQVQREADQRDESELELTEERERHRRTQQQLIDSLDGLNMLREVVLSEVAKIAAADLTEGVTFSVSGAVPRIEFRPPNDQ